MNHKRPTPGSLGPTTSRIRSPFRRLFGFFALGAAALVLALGLNTLVQAVASPLTWSAPQSVDPTYPHLVSVSCPSASFCVAVDYSGHALTYNGTAWSAPVDIDGSNLLRSVSCPSASFCAAVDGNGHALTYNGTAWSAPVDIDGSNFLASVSCPSASFCAAVDDNGKVLTYNGTAWSASVNIDPGNVLGSVSCPSASFCAAVDTFGNALMYKGVSWFAPDDIDGTSQLGSVSCPSASFCVAVGDQSALTWNGAGWSTPTDIDGSNFLISVSCPSASFCAAVDTSGNALTYNGTSWSALTDIDGSNMLYSVSCPSASFCAAVDGNGNALLTTSGAPATTPGAPTGLSATAGNVQVVLSWSAPSSNGGSPITGYDVYEGTSPGGESATALNTSLISGTSYTVTGLTNGTTYYFTVKAVNAVGSSAASNEASAIPPNISCTVGSTGSCTISEGIGTTVTGLSTSLSGGGKSGTTISVPTSTAVTDSSTLSGTNASTATGTVTYDVYSNSGCTTAVNTGTPETITTPGTLPASSPVTLSTAGTYYWQASYSGDTNNESSESTCGTAANGGEVETVTIPVTPQPTSVSTSLSGGGKSGTSISVPTSTAVTDSSTLSGTNASTATGTVTYDVYSNSGCTTAVSTGTPETITTPGTLPASSPVTLSTAGTYYWKASYSGDTNNESSESTCGTAGEVETVTPPPATSTSLSTSLSGGGKSGTSISVPTSTAVTDSSTLSGTNASTATGTVTYDVYSNSGCTTAVSTGTPETITTPGTLPASTAVTLSTAGTYYWKASYSGDANNESSESTCGTAANGGEVETVTPPPATSTSLSTSLSGGGKSGTSISVPTSTAVTDSSTLSGTNASTATGTVTYDVYSNSGCTTAVSTGTPETITTPGTLPASTAVTLSTAGTYYWKASYSGDANNESSESTCGTAGEVETVTSTTTPQHTNLKTLLSGSEYVGGGKCWWLGDLITVFASASVTDSATLSGANVSSAGGTVTYTVYSVGSSWRFPFWQWKAVASGGTVPVTDGSVPSSKPLTLPPGVYEWQASYSGDALNAPSTSPFGSETETVIRVPHCNYGWHWGFDGGCKRKGDH